MTKSVQLFCIELNNILTGKWFSEEMLLTSFRTSLKTMNHTTSRITQRAERIQNNMFELE